MSKSRVVRKNARFDDDDNSDIISTNSLIKAELRAEQNKIRKMKTHMDK